MRRLWPLLLVPLLPLLAACDADVPARATAQRIETRAQLIGGPKALGQIGDYLLENDRIRVIVHGPGISRANTLYGGTIIDADLQRPGASGGRGNDQLGELLPSFNLEIMNPVTVRITSDGADGGPAVITVEGKAADLLQMVATLSKGLLFSPELQLKEELRLRPGANYVEIVTSITNTAQAEHPLPFLDPPELQDLFGTEIPDIENIEFSVPVGHLLIFGGENQAFTPGIAGFNVKYAIEDTYATASGFPAFPGMVAEYLATRSRGISYGFMTLASPNNYPTAYRHLYEPRQEVTEHSLLLPYVYSAITGVYTTNPPPQLAPGETFAWTSYFIIGRGDVASVVDVMHELRETPTGIFAGRLVDARDQAPVAGAMIMVLDPAGRVVNQLDSDDNGAFLGHLAPGSYLYRIVTHVRDTTPSTSFKIEAGRTTSILAELDPPARIAVQVVDELGREVPSKVSLIGRYQAQDQGKDPRTFLYDLRLGERPRSTTMDPDRNEFIEASWYLHDGTLNAEVRPGSYDLAVMRGVEYDLHEEPVMLAPGAFVSRRVVLRRAFETPGYVTADLHLHSANSMDSSVTLGERVTSIAAEGIEFAASTDHNFITDYQQPIAELGLSPWLTATVGIELTSLEMGHFNAYPLRLDPGSVRGGTFNWVGETPDSMFRQLRALGFGRDRTLVQVNHPRDGVQGYFSQFNLAADSGEVEARSGLRAIFAPYKPEFAPENFSYDFDVLEILNAKRMDLIHHYRVPDPLPPGEYPEPPPVPGEILRDAAGKVAFPGQVEDWFTFLSRGAVYTAVGNSDSHETFGDEPGWPRNFVWVGEGKDQAGAYTPDDVVAGIKAGRVVASYGPMIDLTVEGQPLGSLVSTGGSAEVAVRVTSASFAPVDTLILYVNGEVAREIPIPSARAHDFSTEVTLPLDRDAFIVAEATGRSGNLFPILPPQEFEPLNVDKVINALSAGFDLTGLSPAGDLKPERIGIVYPLAITNPIFCDRDGNGRFDAPRPSLPRRPSAKRAEPDVRATFEGLVE